MKEAPKATEKTLAGTKKVERPKPVTEVKKTVDPPAEKGMPEWLPPILSALGGMGGSYLLWLRPLQAKVELLSEELKQTKEELKDLKLANRELQRSHKSLKEGTEHELMGLKLHQTQEKQFLQNEQRTERPERNLAEEEDEDIPPRIKNSWRYKRKSGITLLK
jgi:hypothetical protein